jgi:hypothetical protein
MLRLLLFMHHIAFAPHASHHVYIGSCMCIWDRSRGAETGDKKEQIQGVFGGPQATSCEDANIIVIKANPSASNHHP